ncbi:penicillin-binding protein 1B [Faucicola atlantae]|uniref:penicillin-binding protein 1B n=1 Tax=Faucicola atlantae TaxID=34059 RepID=UPI0025AF31BF|nr:penicillin-binding protein 1B [Moraxella atlantae]
MIDGVPDGSCHRHPVKQQLGKKLGKRAHSYTKATLSSPLPNNGKVVRVSLYQQRGGYIISFVFSVVVIAALVWLALYVVHQDRLITRKFEGKRWNIPAKVYSQPLQLYQDAPVRSKDLEYWLSLINYRAADDYHTRGTYQKQTIRLKPSEMAAINAQYASTTAATQTTDNPDDPNSQNLPDPNTPQTQDAQNNQPDQPSPKRLTSDKVTEYYIHTREFGFSQNQHTPEQVVRVVLQDDRVVQLQSTQPNAATTVLIEPVLIGGIYPDNNEDRIVLDISRIPKPLIDALIATEDREFYTHHGISLRGTARALVSNLTGGSRQGGSTITQQLIKNFYLNSDRTVKRKANEALMALLLEYHYSKQEILQTYINEINLGQNGNHSINGFGLAAQFYFNRPLSELRLDQYAMLVGLAKGPTQYNPFRDPDAALARRNVVLHNMLTQGTISQAQYEQAIAQPLDVIKSPSIGQSRFPDYLDIVKRELNLTYDSDDLKNEGMRIFTSFDPLVQQAANQAVSESLKRLNKANRKTANQLQAALVSADPQTGELLAVVGSGTTFTGFNRAIDAKRQVGSLLKPIIYLTAFEQGKYNLASSVDDAPIRLKLSDGNTWTPTNYGGGSHGQVPLMTALANSYNQAAVRVGLDVGVPNIIAQLHNMGISKKIPEYPAMLLGALNLSPLDMLGVYQVLANGGYRVPIHTIRSVVDGKGQVIQTVKPEIVSDETRAEFDSVLLPTGATQTHQPVSPPAVYQTNFAMQKVVQNGTAKAALKLGEDLNLAGKTGTTNDYRDAWFAGYSGNRVSVVWVGRDDNTPMGLSGATGALPMWIDFMQRLYLTPVALPVPSRIEPLWLQNGEGTLSDERCANAVLVPVDTKFLPEDSSQCAVALYRQEQERRFERQRTQDAADLFASTNARLQRSQGYAEATNQTAVVNNRTDAPDAANNSYFNQSQSNPPPAPSPSFNPTPRPSGNSPNTTTERPDTHYSADPSERMARPVAPVMP